MVGLWTNHQGLLQSQDEHFEARTLLVAAVGASHENATLHPEKTIHNGENLQQGKQHVMLEGTYCMAGNGFEIHITHTKMCKL